MSSYTIGQVAQRTGVPATTLRYYEGIELVTPASRSAAGYRLYDDRALERLAFISQAKSLGCTLDEVADLVAIWDAEECAPVQRRFHELVTDKIAAAEQQITELTELTSKLRRAATLLARPAIDGPCDERCACLLESTGDRVP